MSGFQSKKASADDKAFERYSAIEFLVDEDFDYIQGGSAGGLELLRSYLEFGFQGYDAFTDAELKAEIKERMAMKEYFGA